MYRGGDYSSGDQSASWNIHIANQSVVFRHSYFASSSSLLLGLRKTDYLKGLSFSHLYGRQRWNSWFQASAWCCSCCCEYEESGSVGVITLALSSPSVFLSLCLLNQAVVLAKILFGNTNLFFFKKPFYKK